MEYKIQKVIDKKKIVFKEWKKTKYRRSQKVKASKKGHQERLNKASIRCLTFYMCNRELKLELIYKLFKMREEN